MLKHTGGGAVSRATGLEAAWFIWDHSTAATEKSQMVAELKGLELQVTLGNNLIFFRGITVTHVAYQGQVIVVTDNGCVKILDQEQFLTHWQPKGISLN